MILIVGLCAAALFWVQGRADPEIRAAIEDASPPSVQLSFDAGEDGFHYPEYYEAAGDGSVAQWIPIPGGEQSFHEEKHMTFIEIPGAPTPKSRILPMVRVDKIVQLTIFPQAATACRITQTACPAIPPNSHRSWFK